MGEGVIEEPLWLALARELQAIAQAGLTYATDAYDRERFERIRGIAAEMMAAGSGVMAADLLALFREERGYQTPKVDVRGAVFRDGRVLLVRERSDGRWSLPGGWAEVGRTPAQAIEREILEESGFAARIVKLAALWDGRRHGHVPPYPHHVYKLAFLCEITGGTPQTGLETSAVDFFALDALPELSLPRITAAQIHRLFEHWQDRGLPTDID
jgi:ADP-ribose pyrophosphatase YjhB (NUDIX family)